MARRWQKRNDQEAAPSRSPWVALLLLVLLAITLGGIFPFRQIIAQNRQVADTRSQLEDLQSSNQGLRDEIRALRTDTEIERLAREEYGLVRPGEKSITVTGPEGVAPELEAARPSEPAAVPDDRTFPEKLWDFLTGRDLDPDG